MDLWNKKGLIIEPKTSLDWMQSFAMVPTVEQINDNIFRVYFSGRNELNQSHIGYADMEVSKGNIEVLSYSNKPILSPGELGYFDDSGVTPSSIVNVNNKKYLYYIGWRSTSSVRMELVAGLAVSSNGINFERYSKVPILHRSDNEPISILTAPFVIQDNDIFKMWYVSGICWAHKDLPQYNIKYAESNDGINWHQTGKVAIALNEGENALARPFVIKENDLYKMWFSYKKDKYQLGYAESDDGICWDRKDDEVGISPSNTGWDSEMIEYAFIFEHQGIKYMLYNGNEYGKSGIGYAVKK
jgi:hypothetical protein